MDHKPQFGVELLRPSHHVVLVHLQGELDIYSARQFKAAVFEGISEGATRVIVDLGEVVFIDSTALGVVASGVRTIDAQGGILDIVCGDKNITRLFEITGLDRVLQIYGSRDEALAA
jgi:anti-sigma B factor antagonist